MKLEVGRGDVCLEFGEGATSRASIYEPIATTHEGAPKVLVTKIVLGSDLLLVCVFVYIVQQ